MQCELGPLAHCQNQPHCTLIPIFYLPKRPLTPNRFLLLIFDSNAMAIYSWQLIINQGRNQSVQAKTTVPGRMCKLHAGTTRSGLNLCLWHCAAATPAAAPVCHPQLWNTSWGERAIDILLLEVENKTALGDSGGEEQRTGLCCGKGRVVKGEMEVLILTWHFSPSPGKPGPQP